MNIQRSAMVIGLALGLFLSSSTGYALATCRSFFASAEELRLTNIQLSDPKKLKLVEAVLQRTLTPTEMPLALAILHARTFSEKSALAKQLMPDTAFSQLYNDGTLQTEARSWTEAQAKEFRNDKARLGLNDLEVNLIDRYSADLYYSINRNYDSNSQVTNVMHRTLFSAMTKLPVFSGTVYRGVLRGPAGKYKTGDTIEATRFWSASQKPAVAKDWVDEGLVLVIETFSGRSLGHFARYPSEAEIVILPGTKFQVIAQENGVVYLRELKCDGQTSRCL
jgi:hypothetical protein